MQISSIDRQSVALENNAKTKLIVSSSKVVSTAYNVVVAPDLDGSGFHITVPGEYEVGQMSIVAQASSDTDKLDIVEIIVDDVSVVTVFPEFKYSQRIHDNLGSIDVLVYMNNDVEKLAELINKFDPEVVIGIGECEELVLRNAGINQIESLSKQKFSSEQFGAEEFSVQGYVLN